MEDERIVFHSPLFLYYFDMIMPKPPVELDDIRENLRGTHQLSEPRFGKAFRPLHEFLHGIPVEQGSGDRGVILENTADIVRAQAGINRMKGFRIRTFLAVNDLFGQFIDEPMPFSRPSSDLKSHGML